MQCSLSDSWRYEHNLPLGGWEQISPFGKIPDFIPTPILKIPLFIPIEIVFLKKKTLLNSVATAIMAHDVLATASMRRVHDAKLKHKNQ